MASSRVPIFIRLLLLFSLLFLSGQASRVGAASPSPDGLAQLSVVLEAPVYNPHTNQYNVPIRVLQPDQVSSIEIIVQSMEDGTIIQASPPIAVLGRANLSYSFSLQGQPAGEYRIILRAFDIQGQPIQREKQFGGGNILDLASVSIKYQPPQEEKPTFRIISVRPDFENALLLVRLDIPGNVHPTYYQGLLSTEGTELAVFPLARLEENPLQLPMPPELTRAPGRYTLILYLQDDQNRTSDPQTYEFELTPPPPPSFFQRVGIALKTHPSILISIVAIILALILIILIRNHRARQTQTISLHRPPVNHTLNPAAAPPAQTPPSSSSSSPQRSHPAPRGSRPSSTPRATPSSRPASSPRPPRPSNPASSRPASSPRPPSPRKTPIPSASAPSRPQPSASQETQIEHTPDIRLQLTILESPDYQGPRQLQITRFPFLIGRSQTHLVLADKQVSRQHLRLEYRQGRVHIIDLESKNGTFINDTPVPPFKPVPIEEPCTLRLGHRTQIRIELFRK